MGPSPAAPQSASPLNNPRLRARAITVMFLIATVVGFYAGFYPAYHARPPHIAGHSTIFLIPVVSLITTVFAHFTAARWPDWFWLAMLGSTNLLVGMAVYNAGTIPSGAEIFLMWTLVFSAAFMQPRFTVLLGVEAGAILAFLIAIGPATVTPVTLWLMLVGSFVGVAGVVGALRHQLEAALERNHADAMTDLLTGLGNRRRLMADLEALLRQPEPVPAGIAMFDLDGFKAFNDRFGHTEGDDLLARLGPRLRDSVAGAGTAYRLGGDEFCVLLHCEDRELPLLVERARRALTEDGTDYGIGASCGHLDLAGTQDIVAALQQADARLYADKRARTGGLRVAVPASNPASS